MNKRTPTLFVFSISHYCEKAAWALDYLGIDHRRRVVAAGLHALKAKRLGAPRTALPLLALADKGFVQGSSEIIDWAEANRPNGSRSLAPGPACRDPAALEQRLTDVLGVHVRRIYYSEALVDYPETVRPLFTAGLPLASRLFVKALWPGMRRSMIKGMDLGKAQREESKRIVEGELDWLDGLLADGKPFLAGARLSRLDIAAASLLSPLALPDNHAAYKDVTFPPLLQAEVARWAERPCLTWTRDIYRRYRDTAA